MNPIQPVDYSSQVAQLKSELEAYFREQNINVDFEDYLSQILDELPVGALDHPSLEQYFQLAYKQLVQLRDPDLYYSLQAEVGGPPSFETLYEHADAELNGLITGILSDEPEIMALFAQNAGGEIEGSAVLDLIASLITEDDIAPEQRDLFQETRAMADEYQLGSGFDWIIDFEEGYTSLQYKMMDQLAAIQEEKMKIMAGDLPEAEKDALIQQKASEETILTMLATTEIPETMNSILKMVSDIIKTMQETTRNIVTRYGV